MPKRKAGRPKGTTTPKTMVNAILVRLNDEQFAAAKAAALADDRPVAQWCRIVIAKAAEEQKGNG